jgi:hypothetical protein
MRSLLTLAAILALSVPAAAQDFRVTLLGGDVHRKCRISSISRDKIAFRDGRSVQHAADLADLVSLSQTVSRPAPEAVGAQDVVLMLRGGDRIRGALLPGTQDRIGISSPLLGPQGFLVDDVEEVRFLEAWEKAVERPVYEEGQEEDVFVYRNLDRLPGTLLNLTPDSVIVHCRVADKHPIRFDKLLAIRFADAPAPEPPKGPVSVLLLTDGSRITAKSLLSDGRTLRVTTLRGDDIELEMTDLVNLIQKGGRFDYLSDLEPASAKVVPWIGEEYEWDRPRFDRSFLDRTIHAGGETYRKGIGVISGTSITWRLPDGYTWRLPDGYRQFTSQIALDDAAGEEGDVVFEVLVDGEVKFRSETVRRLADGKTPARIPPVSVAGAKELTLRVTYVDDFVMDFADWIEPMLVR